MRTKRFPWTGKKIAALLVQLREFGVSFMTEKVEDWGQYGLDTPVCTIHMETEEDTYEILLGDYSDMNSERYVAIGDGNAYLVKDDSGWSGRGSQCNHIEMIYSIKEQRKSVETFAKLTQSDRNHIVNMSLHLFGRFVKIILYPLIDDSEVSINKKGHKIRGLLIVCFP